MTVFPFASAGAVWLQTTSTLNSMAYKARTPLGPPFLEGAHKPRYLAHLYFNQRFHGTELNHLSTLLSGQNGFNGIIARRDGIYMAVSKSRPPVWMQFTQKVLLELLGAQGFCIYGRVGPVSPFRCQVWFGVLAASCVTLQCALDTVIILRIYELYLRNPRIFVLIALVSIPYLITFVLVFRSVLKEDAFNQQCDLKHTPIEAVPLGVTTIISHLALWLATFSRRNIATGQAAVVVDLTVKGGHWILALLFCFDNKRVYAACQSP
ncbi:hypothetical protein CPC08DRAFT_752175 [Agrocybe pediades]|nr:hypothetical protein CPC08DRAFT_752175 [Agrocybe pediades]